MSIFSEQFDHIRHFVVSWAVFFGFGLITIVLYIYRGRDALSFKEVVAHCVPFDVWRDKSFHADIKIYAIDLIVGFIFTAPGIFVAYCTCRFTSELFGNAFPSYQPNEFSILTATFCTIVMFFFVEFAEYIFHSIEHRSVVLWELHKVHHSAETLNPLTEKRLHPLSRLLGGISRGLITGFPAGALVFSYGISVLEALSLSVVAARIFTLATLNPLRHSHYAVSFGVLDKVLISPLMHQAHHSKAKNHWDKNFGRNLSIFDWLFQTAYKPQKNERIICGLSDNNKPTYDSNSLHGVYIAPLLEIKNTLVARKEMRKNTTPSSTPMSSPAAHEEGRPIRETRRARRNPVRG